MFLKKKPFPEILFVLLIAAIVYLPNAGKLTYFKDDWYYVYDGMIAGSKVFHEMFRIDRPARGYFFEWYFAAFGPNALPWHIGAFLWRALSAVGALSIFNILWNKDRKFAFLATLFFTIFPGYYWWVSAIEYQPMIASLALQVWSIAFTLNAIRSGGLVQKISYTIGSLLTGWAYIALVDYAIGMEVFRFLCVYILLDRTSQDSFWRKFAGSIRALGWGALIPVGFTIWRVFIFDNQRQATDIGVQLSAFFANPVMTGASWFLQFFNSLLNLGILAWLAQFPKFFFGMRMREIAPALLLAILTALLVHFALKVLRNNNDPTKNPSISREALLLGGLGMLFGVAPVVMANRYINLDTYSHYALPASLASAVFIVGLINSFVSSKVRFAASISLAIFATLAHYGMSVAAVNEETAIQKFWHQTAWRIPALQPDITLLIHYPSGNIGDDGNGVMEAANAIYFPEPSPIIPVHYNVSALTLNDGILADVLQGRLYLETQYRSHTANYNYANVLILSQPTPNSCVHVIDGELPLISISDPSIVRLAATKSNIANVLVDSPAHTPQEFAFGTEPEHAWCYYFEKAELALQMEDWEKAAQLGEEAITLGLHPEDQSEWMPFLKAYAITGNEKRVKQTAPKINTERFLRHQACEMLTQIEQPLQPGIRDLIASLYCKTAPK